MKRVPDAQPEREPDRNRVIVLLTGSECEVYPGMTCVMEVRGPYTREEAEAEFAMQPSWAAPHMIIMHRDDGPGEGAHGQA